MAEAEEQMIVAQFLDYTHILYYHIPNEAKRTPAVAKWLQKLGMKKGVPDLCICEPRGKYHGLYIEMKFGKNKPTDSQKQWLRDLVNRGYAVSICYSADSAIKVIRHYMSQGDSYGNKETESDKKGYRREHREKR